MGESWTAADIPDQTGKVVIVTGGNSGIGFQTCKSLLSKGAKVYLGARSQERAEQAIKDIKAQTGKDDIHWLKMDLADIASVRAAADHFESQERELHQLYNNAGIMAAPFELTKDGYESQWGTNVIGHFVFTQKLLPILERTAAAHPAGTVRVINVSSLGHNFAPSGGVEFEDLTLQSYWFAEWRRYGQSKLANILMTKEITRRYGDKGIFSLALHPGNVNTNLSSSTAYAKKWFGAPMYKLMGLFLITPENGARTQLYAGTSPEVVEKNLNGAYLVPYATVAEPSAQATDAALAAKLWDYLTAESARHQ